MFSLSWQITALSLVLLPLFVLPARRIGTRLQEHHPRVVQPQRLDERDDDRAVQRGRRAAGQAVRPAAGRGRIVLAPGPHGCATSASPRPCTAGCSSSRSPWSPRSRQALVYGLGGYYALTGTSGSPGTVVTLALLLTRLYGPLTALSNVRVDVMSALVTFDRVFEVLDLAPMIADAPDADRAAGRRARSIEFDDVHFRYPTAARGLAGLAGGRRRARHGAGRTRCCTASRSAPSRAAGRAGRAVRRRQDDDQPAGAADLRRRRAGAVRVGGLDVRDVTLQSLRDRDRRRHPGRAPVPRHDPREPASTPARRDRGRAVGGAAGGPDRRPRRRVAARRAGHRGRRPRLPAVRRREAAPGDRPAAAQGAAASSSSTRPPPTWTASPRSRVQRALAAAR